MSVEARCRLASIADPGELFADAPAVDPDRREGALQLERSLLDRAPHHVWGEAGALLVGEEGDGERPAGAEPGVVERGDHLEGGEHTEVAVEDPAGADGVDMRTADDGRQVCRARTSRR